MIEHQPTLTAGEAGDAAGRPLVDDVRQLVDDGRTLLEAELAYQKSRAAVVGSGAIRIAGWAALALALIFFALMALVVGLLLALTPLIGGWGAMALVVLGLLGAAGIAGRNAMRRWQKVSALLVESTSDTDGAP